VRNLTRGEKKAIKDLKSDDTIIVTKADKGNAVVVMDKAKYIQQVNNMLDDSLYTHHR
jgi:mannitol-specific phosphotransferase system IIBC component